MVRGTVPDEAVCVGFQMELSKQTLDGLALVTKENFDDAAFKALLATAFRVAAGDAKQGAEEKLACKSLLPSLQVTCAQP
jgi:hypothetical protein